MGVTPSSLPEMFSAAQRGGIQSASTQNKIASILSNITGQDGIRVLRNYQNTGLIIKGTGAVDNTPWSFQCSLASPVVSITGGSIRTSTANYSVADADVTLTGLTEWVYVYHERDHTASGFGHSATEPLSSGTRWIWPLAYYTASAGVYTLSRKRHEGDVFLYEAMS